MTVLREPSADQERQLARRAADLDALLEAAREAGLTGQPEYGWKEEQPAEPRIVVAGVPVHVEGTRDAAYVIDGGHRIDVGQIQLALGTIRAITTNGNATPRA